MLLSLGLIFVLGFAGGWLFEKIRLPKLVFYMLLGILLGPSLLDIVSPDLLDISSALRQIALVIIITRSGLSLDLATLKKIGRPAILMCFLPACFEIVGIVIFAPLMLGISVIEALLLGSVLAAVSPAVVVPRMIRLQSLGYSQRHSLPELVMAGASCDDVFVIVLFYSFKGLVATDSFSALSLMSIPLSIVLGLALGAIVAPLVILLFKKANLSPTLKVTVLLGVSLLMTGLEQLVKDYVSVSSLLGIMLLGILVLAYDRQSAQEASKGYNSLWSVFEILLFFLVGCATDVRYAFSVTGAKMLAVILLALVFRSAGVLLCVVRTRFSVKEKIFIALSYLPKATVQASIGGIALTEGLACGKTVLTAAVIAIIVTAPIGALLMDALYKKLLEPPYFADMEFPKQSSNSDGQSALSLTEKTKDLPQSEHDGAPDALLPDADKNATCNTADYADKKDG